MSESGFSTINFIKNKYRRNLTNAPQPSPVGEEFAKRTHTEL